MRYSSFLFIILLFLVSAGSFAASSAKEWDDPPLGLQPELRRLHVVSSARKSSGPSTKIYTVDAWYFDTEMIVRVRSTNSDMLGFEDKAKSQAAYWEKGIDKSTGYFPKEFLDGFLTDLVAHAYIWFYQQPIRKIMQPVAARTETDPTTSLTTVTLRIPHPFDSTNTYHSTVYRNNQIIANYNSGTFGGAIKKLSWTEYRNYDGQTGLPRFVVYHSLVPPYTVIRHEVKSIKVIPGNVSAQSLLKVLSKDYRPIAIRMLNDPAGRMKQPSGNPRYWALRIAAAGIALVFLIYGFRRALRRGRR